MSQCRACAHRAVDHDLEAAIPGCLVDGCECAGLSRPMPELTEEQARRIAAKPAKPWNPPEGIEGVF